MRLVSSRVVPFVVVLAAAAGSASCSKSDRLQAVGRNEAARPITVESVREDVIHRAVEVVGTLAAEDEVLLAPEDPAGSVAIREPIEGTRAPTDGISTQRSLTALSPLSKITQRNE